MSTRILRVASGEVVGFLVIGCIGVGSPAHGQDRVWKQFHDVSQVSFGSTMDSLGDLDGDGVSDLIVGAFGGFAYNVGLVSIYSGATGSSILQLHGLANEDFGFAVSRTGDVDGDGVADFAVGTFDPGATKRDRGRVQVYSGATAGVIWSVDGSVGDFLGCSIADAGDLNGDGIDDLIVGARFGLYAREMSGKDGSTLLTITSPSPFPADFGWTVAAGGDIDGDGVPDVMVSDPYNCDPGYCAGAAYVTSGATGVTLDTIYGRGDSYRMGLGMAILGDVNGDGYADYGAGSPFDGSNSYGSLDGGYAVISSGKDGSVLYTYEPDNVNSDGWEIGSSLASIGDMNHDGFDDFMIGAIGAGDYYRSGNAFLYSGRDGGLLYRYDDHDSNPVGGPEFGAVLAEIEDVNADGHPDFAVTAPNESSPTVSRCGSVSVWTGDDLFVNSSSRIVPQYSAVTLTIGQGVALQPYALFLVDVNGTSTFNLLSLGSFDATGRGSVTGWYGASVGPITVSVRGFALDGSNKLIDSLPETMYLQ